MQSSKTPVAVSTTAQPHCRYKKIFVVIITIIALTALLIAGLCWNRLNVTSENQARLVQQQLVMQKQQTAIEINHLRSSMNNQQRQLASKIAQLHLPSRSQQTLSEVDYLLRLANLNLTLGSNPSSALKLMSLADQRLAQADNPSQNNLRKAIITDMHQLMAYPKVDATGILLNLTALQQQIKQLSAVPIRMIKTTKASQEKTATTWQQRWHNALTQLKSLIIIRHHDKTVPALLAPKQFLFLKDNINFCLTKAQWAVLHQDTSVYTAAISQAIKLLTTYNDHNTKAIDAIVDSLKKLAKINVQPHYPSILNSLQAVQNALAKSDDQAQPTKAQLELTKKQKNPVRIQTPTNKPIKKSSSKSSQKKSTLPSITKSVEA